MQIQPRSQKFLRGKENKKPWGHAITWLKFAQIESIFSRNKLQICGQLYHVKYIKNTRLYSQDGESRKTIIKTRGQLISSSKIKTELFHIFFFWISWYSCMVQNLFTTLFVISICIFLHVISQFFLKWCVLNIVTRLFLENPDYVFIMFLCFYLYSHMFNDSSLLAQMFSL